MTVATIPHVVIDDKGIARVAGSRIRVVDLDMQRTGLGLTPEQNHESYPRLTLGQIYAGAGVLLRPQGGTGPEDRG